MVRARAHVGASAGAEPRGIGYAPGRVTPLERIELLALDVDGVLTDGSLWYGPAGEVMKRFHVRDGHGLVMLREAGVPSAILTARTSGIVESRAAELRIAHVLQGRKDKGRGFDELLALAGVAAEHVAYVGDDVNDLPVLQRAGFSACPADAAEEVRTRVHHVCKARGGEGAVRELCDLLLRARGG
jgi:3-deoxy-D-manno-octulosonate 8-phosphate phosphatase (KDO 8-P phosphatase)